MSAGVATTNRALPILRRRRAHLALLAVPMLLLRAFLPAGFMPVPAADGWIGLCPDAAPLPPALAANHPHAHHHVHGHPPAGPRGGAGSTDHATPCVFAASAACPGPPADLALILPATACAPRGAQPLLTVFSPTIRRVQTPRAPPASVA